jgi:hypothetical protein
VFETRRRLFPLLRLSGPGRGFKAYSSAKILRNGYKYGCGIKNLQKTAFCYRSVTGGPYNEATMIRRNGWRGRRKGGDKMEKNKFIRFAGNQAARAMAAGQKPGKRAFGETNVRQSVK